MKKKDKTKRPKPELSIGIIFRDNIRSLERCLQALEPLRRAIPCQLVMADTGSVDGSRAVAEKYADVLFDFPWIDDFSAARNAVMDRCMGRWYISVDSDEYLDENISELLSFLQGEGSRKAENSVAAVVVRNYMTYEMDGPCSDFYAVRMVRRSAGFRYQGAIHERLIYSNTLLTVLTNTVFHHDGYVGLNTEAGKEKRDRNIASLRKKLEQNASLLTRLQFIESGTAEPDIEEQLRVAVTAVENKEPLWERFGPPILRHAVILANNRKLPELDQWIQFAEEQFPSSYFVQIDINYVALAIYTIREDYKECIRRGEQCLESYAAYRAGRGDVMAQLHSTLTYPSTQAEQSVRIATANAYLYEQQPERALGHLEKLNAATLTPDQMEDFIKLLRWTYCISNLDTAPLVQTVWAEISSPKTGKAQEEQRRKVFIQEASKAFRSDARDEELKRTGFLHYSSGVFAPLTGQCEIGTAAAILETDCSEVITQLLGTVRLWRQLPIMALSHALRVGTSFPPQGVELKLEEMDSLAKRLSENEDELLALIRNMEKPNELSALCWSRAMVFAAMRVHTWRGGADDLPLARAFAEVEREFLPVCYSPEALRPENLFLLPPTHRLGWYCSRAFQALDSGDSAGYIRYLHGGLDTYEGMREMIEILLRDFERCQKAASPELLMLAEQVRTMLAAYDPSDPAVTALKASPVYQKVSYLIEGNNL